MCYRKLIRAFKREAVQFLDAKKTRAVSHLSLKALPAVQTYVNSKRQTRPQDRGHMTFPGLRFAIKTRMLKVSILS